MNGKHGLGGKDAYYIRFDAADNVSHDPFAGFDDISFALDSRPLAPVTVHLSSADTSEFVVTPRTLTFTSSNWNVAQSILVFNVLDNASDGNQTVNLNFSTSSTDSNYNNYSIPPVAVTVVDSDLPRISLSASATSVVEGDNITLTYTLTKPTSPILAPVDPAGSPFYHSSRQSTIDGYSRTLALSSKTTTGLSFLVRGPKVITVIIQHHRLVQHKPRNYLMTTQYHLVTITKRRSM